MAQKAPLLLLLLQLASKAAQSRKFGPFDSDSANVLEAAHLYNAQVWAEMTPEIRAAAEATYPEGE